uniref:Serine/threonine protein kinase putative n=1 Tax=Albugo laibachii Nc14 TaxID=890382 RepID=F0W1J8_9STRA|nr:serine/threonine protein kinase putative [Albugo laibachii Nc14]|eukprot:CCA14927.1 serine/threonine protein kinase putative [Albugo laibachii Nc14]
MNQFGVDLSVMHYNTEDFVPELFHTLRDELISNNGLEYQYIYRTSPDNDSLQMAKEAIDAGRFSSNDFRDPSIYACLLKKLLRELPSPLLGKVPQKCIESSLRDLSDNSDGYSHGSSITSLDHEIPGNLLLDGTIQRLMIHISSQERHILLWLLDHMLEIASHEPQNKMNLMALSIVMAPNLYTASSVDLSAAAKITGQVAELIKALLVWRQNVLKDSEQEAHEFFSESLDTSMEGLALPLVTLSPSRISIIDSSEFYGTHDNVDMEMMYIAKPLTHLLQDSFGMCVSLSLAGKLVSELDQDGSMCESLYLSHQNRFIQSRSVRNIEKSDCAWISTICNHITISDDETRKNLAILVDFSDIEHYPSLHLWLSTVLCIKRFHSMLKSERQAQINIERLRARYDSSILT